MNFLDKKKQIKCVQNVGNNLEIKFRIKIILPK